MILALASAGCAVLKKPVQFVDNFIGSAFFPPYAGLKANIAVTDFEAKTTNMTAEVNASLREMFIEGLQRTNRFAIVPVAKDGVARDVDLIIAVEVLEFDPLISGGSEGAGGGGSAASGTLGSLLGVATNKATITLNTRIVDAASSKILFSERITRQAAPTEATRAGGYKKADLNEGLSAYAGTPIAEAINTCIVESVKYVVQKVPASYYKGDEHGKT
ncbi:MAG: CsgG/HfaB family protein [Candidatus Omnitrophota bacterium]